jgi:hypothetical protein
MSDHGFVGEPLGSLDLSTGRVTVVHVPHVCIIESPSPHDILDKRKEGLALSEALSLAGIRNEYFAVSSEETLRLAFERIKRFARLTSLTSSVGTSGQFVSYPKLFLHFSCHGNDAGIGLTNEDYLTWDEIAELLLDLGKDLGIFIPEKNPVCLIAVCMSSCSGLHGRKMASDSNVCPFICLIGSETEVHWTDSLTAFITFYHHLLHKGRTLARSVKSMNDAAMVRDVFRLVTPAEVGTKGIASAVKVVAMSADAKGKIRWVYDMAKGNGEKPYVDEKDRFKDQDGNLLPFFAEPEEALTFMRTNPENPCQVEYGAAIDMAILNLHNR